MTPSVALFATLPVPSVGVLTGIARVRDHALDRPAFHLVGGPLHGLPAHSPPPTFFRCRRNATLHAVAGSALPRDFGGVWDGVRGNPDARVDRARCSTFHGKGSRALKSEPLAGCWVLVKGDIVVGVVSRS